MRRYGQLRGVFFWCLRRVCTRTSRSLVMNLVLDSWNRHRRAVWAPAGVLFGCGWLGDGISYWVQYVIRTQVLYRERCIILEYIAVSGVRPSRRWSKAPGSRTRDTKIYFHMIFAKPEFISKCCIDKFKCMLTVCESYYQLYIVRSKDLRGNTHQGSKARLLKTM